MAAQELGYICVPAVVGDLTKKQAQRLSINLNLIHGNPLAEQLAPFLGSLDDDVLADIHLEGDLLADVLEFDSELQEKLSKSKIPKSLDQDSSKTEVTPCKCPRCGKNHIKSA